jgi:hypothetical protein
VSEARADDHISKRPVVYSMPGMERVVVRKELVYRTTDGGPLTMDVYYPPDAAIGSRRPAVVFVAGYNDVGYEKMLGCRFKDMAMSICWGQLAAASDMIGIAYTNREPATDLGALLDYVQQEGASFGVDEDRIGLFACSGNVPLALWALMQRHHRLRCGALLYGYTIDLDGATGVAQAAATFRFSNPGAGGSIDDLPDDIPLFLVRAGQEQFPHLNESIDRFVAKALMLNRPMTVVNHPSGVHSFDLLQDNERSRGIIRQILSFLTSQLTPAGS